MNITSAVVAIFLFFASMVAPSLCYGRAFACVAREFNTSEFIGTIEEHMASLRSNNVNKAYYRYTSDEFREATTLEAFKEMVERHAVLRDNASLRLTSLRFLQERGQYLGLLTSKNGEELAVEYDLIKEEKGWKILGFILMKSSPKKEEVAKKEEVSKKKRGRKGRVSLSS